MAQHDPAGPMPGEPQLHLGDPATAGVRMTSSIPSIRMSWPDHQGCICRISGRAMPVTLTRMERDVLLVLMLRPGFVSNAELADIIYANDIDGGALSADNVMRVMIGKLRQKLGTDAIETAHTWGYRLIRPSRERDYLAA